MPKLQNHIVDVFLRKCENENTVHFHDAAFIYDNIAENSPLRQLVVDLIAYFIQFKAKDTGRVLKSSMGVTKEIMVDVLVSMQTKNPYKTWADFKPSDYYVDDIKSTENRAMSTLPGMWYDLVSLDHEDV